MRLETLNPDKAMITEKHILLSAKLIEARDAMRALHGDGWQAQIDQVAPFIRARAKEDKSDILPAALKLAKQASEDNRTSIAVIVLAVAAELTSQPEEPTLPPTPSTSSPPP